MARNRGIEFENQIVESLRPLRSAGVLWHKLHTPAAPASLSSAVLAWAQGVVKIIADLVRVPVPEQYQQVPEWIVRFLQQSTHTPPQPYDLIISAPVRADRGPFESWVRSQENPEGTWAAWCAALDSPRGTVRDPHGAAYVFRPQITIEFALEVKMAASRAKSIPFAAVKPHQAASLERAESIGRAAGVIVGFDPEENGVEVWYIPISVWRGLEASSGRKSLPIESARQLGVRIEIDEARGRTKKYYDMVGFLEHFGATVR